MNRFLTGAVTAIALLALVVAALLLFTDLRVTDQSPEEEAADLLLEGVTVSRCCGKPPSVSVPDVVGSSVATARSALKEDHLKIRLESPRLGKREGLGTEAVVQAQSLPPGSRASPGHTITLFVQTQ